MQINDLVFYKGQQMRVIRGAPVRYGEKRAVVERVSDKRRFTVKQSLLTQRAPDVAKPPLTEEALQILEQCFPHVRDQ